MVLVLQVRSDDVTPPLPLFNHVRVAFVMLPAPPLHTTQPHSRGDDTLAGPVLHDPDTPSDPPVERTDGHAGSGAATFLEQNLLPTILSGLTPGADINAAMCAAYLDCNAALEASGCQHGSTATTVSHPRPGSHPPAATARRCQYHVYPVTKRMESTQAGLDPRGPVSR